MALENRAVVALAPRRRHNPKAHAPRPFDMRTYDGRRVKTLIKLYRERLGAAADDPITAKNIERAAQLTALAESLRAKALKGFNVSDDLVRVERLASTAEKSLQLDRHKQAPTSPLIAEIAAEQRAKWER